MKELWRVRTDTAPSAIDFISSLLLSSESSGTLASTQGCYSNIIISFNYTNTKEGPLGCFYVKLIPRVLNHSRLSFTTSLFSYNFIAHKNAIVLLFHVMMP